MVPRRKQTKISTEQPVRFYKFIALTFLALTIILLGVIMFMSSKRATIVIENKATPVDISESIFIGDKNGSGSLKGQVLTTFVVLSETFYPTGTQEEETLAGGVVTIYNDSNTSQPLVATTRLLTPDEILFRIEDGVTVPANGSVEVEVYADEKGASGNIEPTTFTIPGLNDSKQKVVYAASVEPMTGGIKEIGVLSMEDMRRAEETLRDLLIERGELELSPDSTGISGVFSIIQNVYESSVEIGDEISEFSLSGSATVLGVFYNTDDLQELAENLLSKRAVDDTEVIQYSQEAPTATIEDYDLEEGTATVQIFYDGVAMLNPESKQLERSMFFGKTKDEVRRYLLKLDHVRSVDIKFSPVWTRTVPYVGDHVDIILKEVQ
jgi:hypothetical protein